MKRLETPQGRCLAGAARCNITPPVGIYHRMWGAATHDRSTGIHRPLTATVLYLQNPNGSGVELYDIFSDPYEKQDIAQDNPTVVAALQKLIDTWMKGNTNLSTPTGPVPASVFEWPGEEKGSGSTDAR